MTTWENNRVYCIVYTRENRATVKEEPIGMANQM
jgi:hypothetical protein